MVQEQEVGTELHQALLQDQEQASPEAHEEAS